jgi:hypothetical protein
MDTSDDYCFRVFFNVNDLASMAKWVNIVNTMKEQKGNIFGYAEINTNWKIFQKQLPNSSTTLSKNRFQPTSLCR